MSLFPWPKGQTFFKQDVVTPRVMEKNQQEKADAKAWDACKVAVDLRDKAVCQVTGAYLKAGEVDGWKALERNHLDLRSLAKRQRFNPEAVLTMSRSVHQLWHAGAFALLDKRGRPAKRVSHIDHFAWNRRIVAKGEEPFRVRKGLAVRKDV
jgi:hypothetical protein